MTRKIKDRDISALMFAIIKQANPPGQRSTALKGTYEAVIAGRAVNMTIYDPMVNRIPCTIIHGQGWQLRADIPKDWPIHAHNTKEDGNPRTALFNVAIEGEDYLARDITLMRVFL